MVNINKLKKSFIIPKRTLSVAIILATLAAAVYYFLKHRSLATSLRHISPIVIAEVLVLYLIMLVVLVVIFNATMRLVNVRIHFKENGLINAYSLFMNFFIPGQTGPAFRAYYMKKNHSLKYLDYTIATIIYYLIYGVISVIFVLAGSQAYYISLPLILASVIIAALGVKIYVAKHKNTRINLSGSNVTFIVLATLGQVVLQTIIYAVEIHTVKSGIHFDQVITYTGTANLALFVALTPGAIGIREGFLILTEKLNHISSSTIVLANVIDRSVYIVFLLVLGLAIITLKVKDRLDAIKQDEKILPSDL